MHNYHLDCGPPKYAFKVDIQKAYDIVDWSFLKEVLIGFGFHLKMIAWIMKCVLTTSFSLSINGVLHGFFKGKWGLHHGNHMSPYLFTLVMEVLTLIIQHRVWDSNVFAYHHNCLKLSIVNLCYADDLLPFAHGYIGSARVIRDYLDELNVAFHLVPSISKSTV
ncbi:putative reverse transcriptase domain, reverse transcriptase zinc-binding domain protein [Tanacetum coccineum]